MINFYRADGIGHIVFANGEEAVPVGRVSIFTDNTTNTLVFSEDGNDRFWINTTQELRVEDQVITGTNEDLAAYIAPVFALATGGGGTALTTEQLDLLQYLRDIKATNEQ